MQLSMNKATLRRWAGSMAFIGVLVILAAVFHRPLIAWFGGKSTGRQGGAHVTAQTGPFALTAWLDPDPPGTEDNALVVEVRDSAGKPVSDATVEVVYDMPAMGAMAEMKGTAKVRGEGDGRFRAEFDLPMAGSWTLKTNVRSPAGTAAQDFALTVGTKALSVVGGGAAGGATQRLNAIEYPPAAFDALRSALDAIERARSALAQDKNEGISEAAHTIAEALRAAAAGVPKDRSDVSNALTRVAAQADRLATTASIDDARKAFAELNQSLIPFVGADARLVDGLRVFECPMFDHARWIQRGATADNPYMGTKMPTCGTASDWQASTAPAPGANASPDAIDHYTCSMHPSVKQQAPGKCPICGMDLIPVTKAQQEQGVVMIDEARRQLIGVRTGKVIEAPMQRTFRAVGHVTYDESSLTDVNLKVHGWITKLFVSQTGQSVKRGEPLFQLYSPDLYSAEQDYLLATHAGAPPSAGGTMPSRVEMLGRAARQRLHLLGLGDAQIDALAKSGVPSENITIPAPASGFVIEKNVVEGAAVDAGMRLYRIASLSKVWVEADVYEADLAHVHVGQSATVTLDYLPAHSYDAKVAYLYPYLDPTARTGRVRVELANKELELRPGMYASVTVASDATPRVQVPASAVVYTGPRRLVFVDLGQGRFRPQEIRVGTESDGMYEILSGLSAGDTVATSGVFLIAAEARISTAAKYWDSTATEPSAVPSDSAPPPAAPVPRGGGK